MFKKALIFFTLILIPSFSFAQEQYRRVYVFTSENCKYCDYMKDNFLTDPDIVKSIEPYDAFTYIDINEHPQVAKDWGIKYVPDIFIVQSDNVKQKTIYRWFNRRPKNWHKPKNKPIVKDFLLRIFTKNQKPS